jgi:NDP-sugar pyrophosphorylase family protein
LPVTGQPLLAHTLAALASAGCEKTAINLHHLGDEIVSRFGRSFADMEIVYSAEKEILGTLGALSQLTEFLAGAELVVVINGDSLCSWPIRKVVRRHLKTGERVTLLASSRASADDFGGGIGLDRAGRVVSFAPGRDLGDVARRTVFAGLHVFSPDLVAGLDVRPADFVLDLYEPMLQRGEMISALETSESWFDLGTPARFLAGVCDWAQRRRLVRISSRGWVAADAVIEAGTALRRAVIETAAHVEKGARIEHSIVLSGARIGSGCRLRDSIIGAGVVLPSSTAVERRLVTRVRPDQLPRERDSVVGGLVYSPLV